MSDAHITNSTKLIEKLCHFRLFLHNEDGYSDFISFRDSNGFLGREEDYKSHIAEEARKEMKFNIWKESWIGTGRIAECARKAFGRSGNLVNKNQQIDFKNRLSPDNDRYRPEAERVLYDIYCNRFCDESIAFSNAIKVFGVKYDTIAFLFFLKDDSRFLPISTSHFDKGFSLLGIDYTTSFRCSWENYQGFISIIKEIRTVMENVLPMQGTPRLIDAHSFVWIIQEEKFIKWLRDSEQRNQIEHITGKYIQRVISGEGEHKIVSSKVFIRSADVVKETRKRANGICQYCGQPAPFNDTKGEPYLEVHHIIWLSRGGKDSTDNTAALCPNCHARMHILDGQEDAEKLLKRIDPKK